jgi:hypothetical protein
MAAPPWRTESREARANYDEAVATYRQTVLSAFQSVEDDLVTLRVLEQQGQLQESRGQGRATVRGLTLNQYKSGIVAYSSVITAQTTRLVRRDQPAEHPEPALVSERRSDFAAGRRLGRRAARPGRSGRAVAMRRCTACQAAGPNH